MKTLTRALPALAVWGTVSALAVAASPEVERAAQAARENQMRPGHDSYTSSVSAEVHRHLYPLLDECALQDCTHAGYSNTYTLRVQLDGTVGEAFVKPGSRFATCVADGLKSRFRVSTPPPSDDYWVTWGVSGVMPVPEGCRAELTPPLWHTLKWWMFTASAVFPQGSFRVRVILIVVAMVPFVLALAGWKLLRPDDRERQLALALGVGTALVAVVTVAIYLLGRMDSQLRWEARENALATLLFTFPFLASLPLMIRAFRGPTVPRGSRFAPPRPGGARRLVGWLLLLLAAVPATSMTWFALHENLHWLCSSCVRAYKWNVGL